MKESRSYPEYQYVWVWISTKYIWFWISSMCFLSRISDKYGWSQKSSRYVL